jgi:pimeloyl-ACP methyl ester carboxylesterase
VSYSNDHLHQICPRLCDRSGRRARLRPGHCRIAIGFIEALQLAQVDLLGWSMGGFVATSVAFQRPSLVRKLIVAGSGPGGVPDAPAAPAKVREFASHAVNDDEDDEDFFYLFYPETPTGRAAGPAQLARLGRRAEPAARKVSPGTTKAMMAAVAAFRGPDALDPRLEMLALPILHAGGVDDIMDDAFNSCAAVRKVPNAWLKLYPATGHAFLFQYAEFFQYAEECAGDVGRFLDGANSGAWA